ncbi:MAG TPA: serine protease [Candidatus Binatia bacterium]|jgi:S1-C subfamily serine protease|nr:serine protease [Candidatus Binatia bacterium]
MTRTVAVLVLATVASALANPSPVPRDVRRALAGATVLVLPAQCGGVLLERATVVATALHCVKDGPLHRVRLPDGSEHAAHVAITDTAADQAILTLDEPASATPLFLARRAPITGTVLYFAGNPERPRPQDSRLDRIGRCESLPDLPNALFTSIDGTPGDSGSPLVDGASQVVGLVHGGARCHIATPASTLGPMLDRVLRHG